METWSMLCSTAEKVWGNHIAQAGGVCLGILCFLVEPTAAFQALWIAVGLDLISRICAEAKNHGGFVKAAKEGHIQSDKMFRGTAVKITAYFFMCVLANQSKYILQYDAPAELFSTIVYSILFLVEVWSLAENFEEAGVEAFGLISRFSKKRLDNLIDNGKKGDDGGGGPTI